VADAAVGRHGELDLHFARLRGAQGLGGIARRRRAQRAQRGRRGRRRRGRGRRLLLRATLLGGTFLYGTLLCGHALGLGAGRGVALGGALLLGQLLRGDALLVGLRAFAFGGELALAFGFLLGAQGLLLDAGLGRRVGAVDRGLQALQRGMVGVGARHQRGGPGRLLEVFAVVRLLGGDDGYRHQVGRRAGDGGVAGRLLAQREVVLERVVARGRVQPALGVGRAAARAQLV